MKTHALTEWGWDAYCDAGIEGTPDPLVVARVRQVGRQSVSLVGVEGEILLRFRDYRFPFKNIAIGDWLELQSDSNQPVRILPRRNELVRRASGSQYKPQCLAANLDQVAIVVAADHTLSESRIERCLVLANQSRVPAFVVLTKSDLCDDLANYVSRIRFIAPKTPCFPVDARETNSCSDLLSTLQVHQTVAMLGSSGVGKSTLVNTLSQESNLKTQGVREGDLKGRHTTVSRALVAIAGHGLIIDSPGLREFGLLHATEAINHVFEDVVALSKSCKFNDCSHRSEPGCEVQIAIEQGKLERRRINNYLRLVEESDGL